MDHRGFGADAQNVHQDVLGVVRSLRAGGARKVSVVGASWGGWAAATAAIMQPGLIDRLVLLAHSPYENPQNLGGRKLFIVASDDPGSDGAPRLAIIRRQFDLSPEPKALVVLDGAAHAQRLFDTPEGSRLFPEILLFLKAP
jgi:pimeloyl-ACP methyl ester carboxylesterase